MDTILSLYRLRTRLGVSSSKLSADILEGAARGIGEFQIAEGVDFVARLTALLDAGLFDLLTIKARGLLHDVERTFCEARVLTDIRPVFDEEIGQQPATMLIVHTLKIEFHEGDSHKEIFVAMDLEDINSLRKVLERAEEKAKRLKGLLDSKSLPTIDLK